MATITLVPENLDELDQQQCDVLVLSFFSDEKPLKGLNGLADWRTCGRLSRMLMRQDVVGNLGEKTLMNTAGRLPHQRIILWGLGEQSRFDNMAFVRSVEQMFRTVRSLKADSCALCIPGAQRTDDFILERMAILIKEIRLTYDGQVVLMMGKRQNFKEMQAKFDLIQEEVGKVVTPRAKGRA